MQKANSDCLVKGTGEYKACVCAKKVYFCLWVFPYFEILINVFLWKLLSQKWVKVKYPKVSRLRTTTPSHLNLPPHINTLKLLINKMIACWKKNHSKAWDHLETIWYCKSRDWKMADRTNSKTIAWLSFPAYPVCSEFRYLQSKGNKWFARRIWYLLSGNLDLTCSLHLGTSQSETSSLTHTASSIASLGNTSSHAGPGST